jgi:hypothetical protein
MQKQRSVLMDLTGPVAVLVQDFYEWAITVAKHPDWVSPPFVMIQTEMFVPFIEFMLYEIFKEYHHSSVISDVETESTKWLRELGVPGELILKLKCDFLNSVLAIIYGALPDIYFAEIEQCDYALTRKSILMLHLKEDAHAPMYIAATAPPQRY